MPAEPDHPPPRPRVRLTDRLGPGGQPRERPFVIGVLADLGGTRPFPGGGLRPIDRGSFDEVLRKVAPRLKLHLTADDRVVNLELNFGALAGFDPAGLAQQVPEALVPAVLRHPDFLRLEAAWRGLH